MAATQCYSLLLGARRMGSGKKNFSRHDDERLREITFRHFPEGYTILNAGGGWFNPEVKRFEPEGSRQILVCCRERQRLLAWCRDLGLAFAQEELLLVEVGRAHRVRIQASRRRAVTKRL